MRSALFMAGVAALALGAGVSGRQAAAQDAAQDPGDVMQLDTILVTDGLTPIEQEKSGRAYTVITGEQLQNNQVRYVSDALRQVPGFSVSRTGSAGGITNVRVRGAEANHLLVMIDGVEASEMSTGEFDFGSLLTADIDRIEIMRGPQSAFFGSNATAGVINIITRRGERDGWRIDGRSEAGTDGTFLGSLGLYGGGENYDMAVSGAFRRSEGFNISDFGHEKDGDRNTTLNARLNVDILPNLTLDATLRYVDRKSDTDPQDFTYDPIDDLPGPNVGLVLDGSDWTATREFLGSVGLTHVSLDGKLTQKARFSGSDTRRENFESAYGGSLSWDDGRRYNGTYQASYAFDTPAFLDARHQITGGYEWEHESFAPSHLTETLERESHSLVSEYRGEFLDQFHLNAAVRRDFNDAFQDTTTFSLSGAWIIPGTETRLHSSVGTGVTNPTFFEQFGYTPATFNGNPNLVPEESLGWDIGIEQGFFDRRLVIDVTYFNQDVTNEIATVMGDDFRYTVVNLDGKSKRQGVEMSATVDLQNGFTATATYTYVDATDQQEAGGPRLQEVRRPRHAGSLAAAYVFHEDRARIFGEVVFNGKMQDNAYVPTLPPRVTLDAYTLVNVGGSYKLNDHLEAYGRVENLFDEEYEEVFGYNAPGRTAFVGMRGSF